MRRALLLTVLAALLVASAVSAGPPPVQWFSDNFESYAEMTRLRLAAPNWVGGAGPENYIMTNVWTGDKEVRLKGSSGSGASSDAYSATDFSGIAAGKLQWLYFTLQSDLDYQQPGYNHLYIQMNFSSGATAFWYGHSGAVTPRTGNNVGPAVSLLDGAIHEFEVKYDPATGVGEWLHNGSLQWTFNLATGLTVSKIYVKDVHRVDDLGNPVNDWVWMDDVSLGTVPEPSSLMALCAFGAGAFGLIRRRRI